MASSNEPTPLVAVDVETTATAAETVRRGVGAPARGSAETHWPPTFHRAGAGFSGRAGRQRQEILPPADATSPAPVVDIDSASTRGLAPPNPERLHLTPSTAGAQVDQPIRRRACSAPASSIAPRDLCGRRGTRAPRRRRRRVFRGAVGAGTQHADRTAALRSWAPLSDSAARLSHPPRPALHLRSAPSGLRLPLS